MGAIIGALVTGAIVSAISYGVQSPLAPRPAPPVDGVRVVRVDDLTAARAVRS